NKSEYKLDVARLYLVRLFAESRKIEEQQNKEQMTFDAQRAIAYLRGGEADGRIVKGAVEVSPKKVSTWETLGATYRDLSFAQGARTQGIAAFLRAVELEPSSPVLRTELGKLFATEGLLEEAKAQFLTVQDLKSDYVEATRQYALVLEQEGDMVAAIRKLENLSLQDLLNEETLFQLGRLYYNEGRTADAVVRFEQALELAPNNSNVWYSLGVAFEDMDRTSEAISAFTRVLELNPGSTEVQERLQLLR
ncbi:MAG: tetratricopeptide repeat protein, partial [archaeon]|nr:tetratricopeptide repeat protein [archaeon]